MELVKTLTNWHYYVNHLYIIIIIINYSKLIKLLY